MTQSGLPLYPKLSPIYNKIMQLTIAIVLLIVLLNVLIFSSRYNERTIDEHFYGLSRQLALQTATTVGLIARHNNKEILQQYIDSLVSSKTINSLHYYDVSGRLLAHSENAVTVQELYGISKNEVDHRLLYIPFVDEIRTDNQLQGYVRLTVDKKAVTTTLSAANGKTSEFYRMMLVLAGVVGFLLTRGLNRFSRQGFRLGK